MPTGVSVFPPPRSRDVYAFHPTRDRPKTGLPEGDGSTDTSGADRRDSLVVDGLPRSGVRPEWVVQSPGVAESIPGPLPGVLTRETRRWRTPTPRCPCQESVTLLSGPGATGVLGEGSVLDEDAVPGRDPSLCKARS